MIDLCRTKCLQKIGMQKLTHFLAEVTFLRVPITQLIAVFFGQIEIGTRVALTYYIHQLVVGMKSTRHPFSQRLFVGIANNDATTGLDIAVGIDVDLPHFVRIKFRSAAFTH